MKTFFEECAWLFRHKGALLILFGAPVIYALFYPLPYKNAVVDNIPTIVWDDENSSTTRDWIHQLDANPKLKVIAVLTGEPNESQWQNYPSAQFFIHFPANSSLHIHNQQQVFVPYGGKADNFLVYSTAVKAITLTLQSINKDIRLETFYRLQQSPVAADMYAEPINVSINELFNIDASYVQYLVPSVFVLLVQQVTMMAMGMQWGYRFEMNRPIGRALDVWLAHIVLYGLQGLVLILFFFKIMLPFQDVPFTGDGLALLQVSIPFVLSVVGFGMVISVGFREQETALIWLLPLSVPMLMMAGVSWPDFAMVNWIHYLAQWLPSTWGVNALIDVTFINHQPDLTEGWRNAAVWLSLGLLVRGLAVDRWQAAAQSTA